MLNDKLIIEMSCNYVYRLEELLDVNSAFSKDMKRLYPYIKIIDVVYQYNESNLVAICVQDTESKDAAVIFQGSTSLINWKTDNFNNFLNRNVKAYDAALEYLKELEAKDYRITHVGGNSLGGGCAQYVGLFYSNIRALCINASPLSNISEYDINNQANKSENIIHIRVNAEPLYRTVMLDKKRYATGYPGHIYTIKRSLFGSYDYFSCVELTHRGSIIFQPEALKKMYQIEDIKDKEKINDPKLYNHLNQLIKAPSLAEYMSFDLVSHNIDNQDHFDLDKLQTNFYNRMLELENSLVNYHLKNIELNIGSEFVNINDSISNELKAILKTSLLQVTQQDEKLFDNIYFVIEKTGNYFYAQIAESINKINSYLVPEATARDYEKIIRDLDINKSGLQTIISSMSKIQDELDVYNNFKIRKFFNTKTIPSFENSNSVWSQNYKAIVFEEIDEAIHSAVMDNKSFINQVDKMVTTALKAVKLTMQIPFLNSEEFNEDDVDFLLNNYDISKIIDTGLNLFKEDFYESILAESLLYIYLVNIRCINEQLSLLLKSLHNLELYVISENKISNKRILCMIKDTCEYAE
ncbi:MAG: Mbeg1-like protein, partial [Erysipelotrichales bacterium]